MFEALKDAIRTGATGTNAWLLEPSGDHCEGLRFEQWLEVPARCQRHRIVSEHDRGSGGSRVPFVADSNF